MDLFDQSIRHTWFLACGSSAEHVASNVSSSNAIFSLSFVSLRFSIHINLFGHSFCNVICIKILCDYCRLNTEALGPFTFIFLFIIILLKIKELPAGLLRVWIVIYFYLYYLLMDLNVGKNVLAHMMKLRQLGFGAGFPERGITVSTPNSCPLSSLI